jgi:hypothetical protein
MKTHPPQLNLTALLLTINSLRRQLAAADYTFVTSRVRTSGPLRVADDGLELRTLPTTLSGFADALGAVQASFLHGDGFVFHGTLRFAATRDLRAQVCAHHAEMAIEHSDRPGITLRLTGNLERFAATLTDVAPSTTTTNTAKQPAWTTVPA